MQPTMLWLNGWGMPNELWSGVHARFPDWRHLIPDYSRVSRPEDFYRVARQTLLKEAEGPLLVIGWSLGGMVAQRLAAEAEVAGIVLVSSTARFVRGREEREKGWPAPYLRQMQAALIQDRKRVMGDFWRSLFSAGESAAGYAAVPFADEWSPEALSAGLDYLCTGDCRPVHPLITCPTLVIHGTADAICPFAAGEELAASIPTARLITLPGCGHAPLLTRQHEIVNEIRRMADEYA
jgi:pimeloyl-[acyl-carrier protein] methyl ester esterase